MTVWPKSRQLRTMWCRKEQTQGFYPSVSNPWPPSHSKRAEGEKSYRFAYLLLPLQHVRHGVSLGELHVAIEHHRLTKNCCNMDCILKTIHWNKYVFLRFRIWVFDDFLWSNTVQIIKSNLNLCILGEKTNLVTHLRLPWEGITKK